MVPSSSDPHRSYTVLVNPYVSITEFVCDCTGFEYRGHCKHQREAALKVCWWPLKPGIEELRQSDFQEADQVCPACGGPTRWETVRLDA